MPTREDEIDWDNLLFTKPAEAAELIERRAVAKARHIIQQDYFRVTNREKWEKMFYRAYPALASHRELVEEVMAQVGTQMPQNTPIERANAEIADRVEARVKHLQRFSRIDEERAMWQGGPGFDGPSPPTPADQGRTLGDVINANRERRKGSRLGRAMSGEKV